MSENINPQTPAVTPAPATGPTVEEVKAEFERTREGLLRDLQEERRKRQEAEQRLSTPASSPANQDVTVDELGKVLSPYISPVVNQLKAAQAQLQNLEQEKAINYLANKLGKKPEEVLNDTVLQDKIVKTAQRWGLRGNPQELMQRALDIIDLEDMRTKEAEKARAATAARAASMPSGAPPASTATGKEYSVAEFNAMPVREYDALADKGDFKKVGDKLVYVLRS